MADKQPTLLELLKQYKRDRESVKETVPLGAPFLEIIATVAADGFGRFDVTSSDYNRALELLAEALLDRPPVKLSLRLLLNLPRISTEKADITAKTAKSPDSVVTLSELRPYLPDLVTAGLSMPMIDLWCKEVDQAASIESCSDSTMRASPSANTVHKIGDAETVTQRHKAREICKLADVDPDKGCPPKDLYHRISVPLLELGYSQAQVNRWRDESQRLPAAARPTRGRHIPLEVVCQILRHSLPEMPRKVNERRRSA